MVVVIVVLAVIIIFAIDFLSLSGNNDYMHLLLLSDRAPEYVVSNMEIPTVLFWGGKDVLAGNHC